MLMENEIQKTITAEGVRIVHPSGLVSLITQEKMEKLIAGEERHAADVAARLAAMKADLEAVKAAHR